MKIIKFESISSTNDYIKEHYETLDNYTVVKANFQTKGRGRTSRVWESASGENLMMSVLVKDFKNVTNFSNIALVTAVALRKCLAKYTNNILIKWPNDLLINSKKISGILTEAISKNNHLDMIVIGIGVNINQRKFSKELTPLTTSLSLEANKLFDIDKILVEFCAILKEELDKFLNDDNSYLAYLKEYLFARGKLIKFYLHDEIKEGTLIDIDEDGKLIIEMDNKTYHLLSGEIKIIR